MACYQTMQKLKVIFNQNEIKNDKTNEECRPILTHRALTTHSERARATFIVKPCNKQNVCRILYTASANLAAIAAGSK